MILIIILPSVFILFMPLMPGAVFKLNRTFPNFEKEVISKFKIFSLKKGDLREVQGDNLEGNKLYISSIDLEAEINEGLSEEVLKKGLWRRPGTGNPKEGGNIVVTGHNYRYFSDAPTFYHLDKVKVNDKIKIFWDNNEYHYEVYDKFVTDPRNTKIEDSTEEDVLTIYTCYPLYTAKKRLVVRARPVEV